MLDGNVREEIDYVRNSQYRLRVIKALEGEVKISSKIADDAEIYNNHISHTLKQLKDHDLVECLNPEDKRGRLYRLTGKGEKVLRRII